MTIKAMAQKESRLLPLDSDWTEGVEDPAVGELGEANKADKSIGIVMISRYLGVVESSLTLLVETLSIIVALVGAAVAIVTLVVEVVSMLALVGRPTVVSMPRLLGVVVS